MPYKPGDTLWEEFCTTRVDTGALTNADSLPTGTLAHNGTDDGTVTVTVTNVGTGRYKATCVIPSGYSVGDKIQLFISATVNSVVGGNIVRTEYLYDPWQIALPGSFSAGSAGYLLGNSMQASDVANAVWGATLVSYTTAGTFGGYLQSTLSVNVGSWATQTAQIDTNNLPKMSVWDWLNTQVTSAITGVPDVNMNALGGKVILAGTVDSSTSTPTTSDFETSFTVNAGSAAYVAQVVYFTSGANAGETFRISAYAFTHGKVHLTTSTMPNAPANGDAFIILGRIGA
jgi:hypothetical protein